MAAILVLLAEVFSGLCLLLSPAAGLPLFATGWLFGAVQCSSFQLVCIRIGAHSFSNFFKVFSSPFRMNHHLVLLGAPYSLTLRLTTRPSLAGHSFFSVDLTAAVVILFRVPHTLLTPLTGVRWDGLVPCSVAESTLPPSGFLARCIRMPAGAVARCAAVAGGCHAVDSPPGLSAAPHYVPPHDERSPPTARLSATFLTYVCRVNCSKSNGA